MVSEELPTEDALSGCRGVTDGECFLIAEKLQRSYRWRMTFLVAEELQTENVLSCCRGARWRMPFLVLEELQMEDALSGFRGATDRGCPFRFQRS